MKRVIIFIFVSFVITKASAQQPGVWVRFTDTSTHTSGFKDLNGVVQVPPAFIIHSDFFLNIVAVMDSGTYTSFYLLKDGRKVGYDSVYAIETIPDCESDGKIRFKDWKKDRVGFLNEKGKVIVPAIYNYACPFMNDLTLARRNAERKCPESEPVDCEHPSWVGGEMVMINDRNEVLADSIRFDYDDINWHSLRINDPSVDTVLYKTVVTENGDVYSFIQTKVEFERWFKDVFMRNIAKGGSEMFRWIAPVFTNWASDSGVLELPAAAYFRDNPKALDPANFSPEKMKRVHYGKSYPDELALPFEKYTRYYTACGEWDRGRYPTYGVGVQYYVPRKVPLTKEQQTSYSYGPFEREYERDHYYSYEFYRSEEGFKLYQIRKGTKDHRVSYFPQF